MKIVIDTNILISGHLWSGKPKEVLRAVQNKQVEAVSSSTLLEEFADVLSRDKFKKILSTSGRTPEQIIEAYKALITIVDVQDVPDVSRDADDNHVVACAAAGKADYIVTGDDDLLVLGSYTEIKIVTASDFLELLKTDTEQEG